MNELIPGMLAFLLPVVGLYGLSLLGAPALRRLPLRCAQFASPLVLVCAWPVIELMLFGAGGARTMGAQGNPLGALLYLAGVFAVAPALWALLAALAWRHWRGHKR